MNPCHLVASIFKMQQRRVSVHSFPLQNFPCPSFWRVECSSICHAAGVWQRSPSPRQAKTRARRTATAVFTMPTMAAVLSNLGPELGRAELQATRPAACFSWLFIQSDCPTNSLPHVTTASQTRAAVAACLKKYWYINTYKFVVARYVLT